MYLIFYRENIVADPSSDLCRMSSTFCSPFIGGPPGNPSRVRNELPSEIVLTTETVTLLPYMIFSLFHALTFTRTTLFPQFLPAGPPATAGGAPGPHPLAKRLQAWVKGM